MPSSVSGNRKPQKVSQAEAWSKGISVCHPPQSCLAHFPKLGTKPVADNLLRVHLSMSRPYFSKMVMAPGGRPSLLGLRKKGADRDAWGEKPAAQYWGWFICWETAQQQISGSCFPPGVSPAHKRVHAHTPTSIGTRMCGTYRKMYRHVWIWLSMHRVYASTRTAQLYINLISVWLCRNAYN